MLNFFFTFFSKKKKKKKSFLPLIYTWNLLYMLSLKMFLGLLCFEHFDILRMCRLFMQAYKSVYTLLHKLSANTVFVNTVFACLKGQENTMVKDNCKFIVGTFKKKKMSKKSYKCMPNSTEKCVSEINIPSNPTFM